MGRKISFLVKSVSSRSRLSFQPSDSAKRKRIMETAEGREKNEVEKDGEAREIQHSC